MYRINFGLIEGVSLNGAWGVLPDPMDRCRRQTWWKSVRETGYFFPSYDDDAFWPTTVPGAFTRLHPGLEFYEGTAVYLRHFEARPAGREERAFLHFEGVSERCSVFLNGRWIGEHEGGYAAFTFEATAALKAQNRLLALVDNRRNPDDVPGLIHDWFHDGGLIRPVTLYYRPRVFVRDVSLTTAVEDEQVAVRVNVLVDAPSRDRVVTASVALIDGNTVRGELRPACRPGSWCEAVLRLPRAAVRLWSPRDPFLHTLSVRVGGDAWEDRVGLREVRTRGKALLLNGQPTVLRGVCTWLEDPVCGIFSMGESTARRAVAFLKDLNCNFARAGHRPQSRAFVRACDEAGILLWMEAPAYWMRSMHRPAESRKAMVCLEDMLREHRNAASIMLWSVGNECLLNDTESEASNLGYFLEAVDYLHAHDPSRLVTYTGGVEGDGAHDPSMERVYPRQILEKLDVVGVNSYAGIHDGAAAGAPAEFGMQYTKIRRVSSWGKPVIHAEAGIDGVLGETGFDFGEERQAEYHRKLQEYFAECVGEGTLQGLSVFVLNDFRTPIKLGRHQRGYNRKGLVNECLQPKRAYDVVRDGYARMREAE